MSEVKEVSAKFRRIQEGCQNWQQPVVMAALLVNGV